MFFLELKLRHTIVSTNGRWKKIVCLGFFVPLENLSLIWRRHHCRWRAANFDLCSAHMVIEQWGFFSVPHILWQGASVYNGHLRGPMTLTPIAENLTVELSPSDFTTKVCRGWESNTQPSACGVNALTNRATAAAEKYGRPHGLIALKKTT